MRDDSRLTRGKLLAEDAIKELTELLDELPRDDPEATLLQDGIFFLHLGMERVGRIKVQR